MTPKQAYTQVYNRTYRERHREALNQYRREWGKKYPERANRGNQAERTRLKQEVLAHYSHGTLSCAVCYYEGPALQLDHIQDNGAYERRLVGHTRTSAGTTFYRWLRKHGFPTGYQVLCANCNWEKELRRRALDN